MSAQYEPRQIISGNRTSQWRPGEEIPVASNSIATPVSYLESSRASLAPPFPEDDRLKILWDDITSLIQVNFTLYKFFYNCKCYVRV